MTHTSHPVIEPMRAEDHAAFAELNRQWLVRYDLLEEPDVRQLEDPVGEIIAPGGQVFVARWNGEIVGTCAVTPHSEGVLELLKLTVAPAAQGQGLGRRLVEACVQFARARGGTRLVLLSNSGLQAALALYRSVGFRDIELPEDRAYLSADVCMELDLTAVAG